MLPSPSSSSSSSAPSSSSTPASSSPRSFHGLPGQSASSASALLAGGDMDEAHDTDDEWEDGASYFPSTASLPALPTFPALPALSLPALSALPATLSSASSSLSSVLSSLPSLSSIPPSDLRQLQSAVQCALSDSLENVVHHAKLFARVGGDWWQGRERDKERHAKLEGQRRRQSGVSYAAKRGAADAEMAEYVAFLTQLVQAAGRDWELVRAGERDQAAVLSGQRLTVVEEHFGRWNERERRMVERIREELKAAKRKELELIAAAESLSPLHNDVQENMAEREEREPELSSRNHQRKPQHDAASYTSDHSPPSSRLSARDPQPPRAASRSTSVDTSALKLQRPQSSTGAVSADVSAIPRASTIRQFDRSPRMVTPVAATSFQSPWQSQPAPVLQSLAALTHAATTPSSSPSPMHRPVEASGYWNTHTQLFIPSSQHAALVSYQAPAAPPLFFQQSLSRPGSRIGLSVVSPAVTLPFTPLAAVVASLVSVDSNIPSRNDTQPLVVSESLLSSSASQPALSSATPASLSHSSAQPVDLTNISSSTPPTAFQTPSSSTAVSSAAHVPDIQPSVILSDLPQPTLSPAPPLPTVPPFPSPVLIDTQPSPPPTSTPSLPAACPLDAPPAPLLDDVPAAPPMDDVPFAPPFDSSIPPPPPMSSPSAPAAALPPPLALSSNTSAAKRSSMKRLHWSKLRYENVQQSVWSQLLQPGASDGQQQDGVAVDVEAMKQLIDVSELEDKFTSNGVVQKDCQARDSPNAKPLTKADDKAAGGSKKGATQVDDERRDNSTAVNSTRNKVSQFTAVDTLRAYNVEIAFSQLKMTADNIKQALLLEGWQLDEQQITSYLDCVHQQLVPPLADAAATENPHLPALPPSPISQSPLCADQLDILSRIVPSDEEASRTIAAPPSATPGTVEQFFRAVCSIPRVRRRVELLAFICNAPAELLSISSALSTLHAAHTSVLSSPSLKRFLALVLLVGNTLNAGTSQGNAYGFRLSWLGEMAQVKTRDGRETMMEFMVRTAEKPATNPPTTPSLSLPAELHAVHAAAAIDTQSLAASLTSLRSLTAIAGREAALLPATDTLHRLLGAWVAGWQVSVQAVEASYERMVAEGKELCRYLAEDGSRSEGAIAVVRDVLVLYSKAKAESDRKQREKLDKLKAKEREAENQQRRHHQRKANSSSDPPTGSTATLLSCSSRPTQQTGPRRRKFVRSQLSGDGLDDEVGGVGGGGVLAVAAVSPSCSPCSSPSSESVVSSLHQSDSCSSLRLSLTSPGLSSSLSSHSPPS